MYRANLHNFVLSGEADCTLMSNWMSNKEACLHKSREDTARHKIRNSFPNLMILQAKLTGQLTKA